MPDYLAHGDRRRLEGLFASFIEAFGFTLSDPHFEDTPRRVVRMYEELFYGESWKFTTFPASQNPGIVLEKNIPFSSLCAHHWLPFTGVAHVAYVPRDKVAGLSKLARVIQTESLGPQVQENIGEAAADFLQEQLNPEGVAVILEARHSCMELRGVKAHGAVTVTSHLRGCFYEEASARAELFALINKS